MALPSLNSSPLWLCLHFERLPIEVFERNIRSEGKNLEVNACNANLPTGQHREAPETRAHAIAVVDPHHIIMANPVAEQSGIEPGMLITHAYSLNEQLRCIEQSAEKEHHTLEQLAQWMYDFTPNVSVLSPSDLLLEVSRCLKLFGSLARLQRLIQIRLDQLGYTVQMGVSTSALASQIAAKNRLAQHMTGKPKSQLQHLPIEAIGFETSDIDKLRKIGVSTLNDLLSLPRAGLRKRLGSSLMHYLEQMLGEQPDPRRWITPQTRFESSLFFTDNVTSQQALMFPAKRLIQELVLFLNTRQLWTDGFTLTLSYRNKTQANIVTQLAQPDHDGALFLRLFQARLEQAPAVKDIDQVALSVTRFYPASLETAGLFDDNISGNDTPLSTSSSHSRSPFLSSSINSATGLSKQANDLISLLRSKFGDESCYSLTLHEDHRPEKSWHTHHHTHEHPTQTAKKMVKPFVSGNTSKSQLPIDLYAAPRSTRPFFLLPEPRRLSRSHAPPEHPLFDYLKGPERISYGWWEGLEEDRDYYIYQYRKKSLYWLFYRPLNHRWYVHGVFA